jgi:ribosomal protein S18 acetylase RimI-like enzyme
MLIRHATLADAERMGFINASSWRTTYTGLIDERAFDAMTHEAMVAKWTRIITHYATNSSFAFVAEIDGEVVGYVSCGPNRHPDQSQFEWELLALYLLKEHQSKGIGKALFCEAVNQMKQLEVKSFVLYVLSSNTPSRKFYESFKPDFTDTAKVIIDQIEYDDTYYGWSDIATFGCN